MDLRTEHAHQLANFFWRRVAVRPKFDIVADEVADERDVESAPVGLVVVEVNTAHLVREVIGSLLGIYPTPQKFYALVIAADAQISPPAGPRQLRHLHRGGTQSGPGGDAPEGVGSQFPRVPTDTRGLDVRHARGRGRALAEHPE